MRRLVERARQGRDDGYTLVELLVAMGIFTIILVIFTAAVVSWTTAAVRNSRVSDQTTSSRVIVDRLDKQVPYASAVNRPVRVGTNYYVEFRSDAVSPSQCTQWVMRASTGEVAYRTWNVGTGVTLTISPWRTLATNARLTTTAGGATVPPWTLSQPALGTSDRQILDVDFDLRQGTGPVTEVSPTLVARNTTRNTVTVNDLNNDGVSDTQVCTEGTRS